MTGRLALFALILALPSAGPSAAQTLPLRAAPVAVSSGPSGDASAAEFGAAIAECWNVSGLSPAALGARVTVAAEFDNQGRPRTDAIVLVSVERGDQRAGAELFESARRALLRCGSAGLPLPPALRFNDRAAHMTFDPAGANLR